MTSTFINTKTVACLGEVGAEHPRIYLNLEETHETTCPYCSQHFVYQPA